MAYSCVISSFSYSIGSSGTPLQACSGYTSVGDFTLNSNKYEAFVDSVYGGEKILVSVNEGAEGVWELDNSTSVCCGYISVSEYSFTNPTKVWDGCRFNNVVSCLPSTIYMGYTTYRDTLNSQYVAPISLFYSCTHAMRVVGVCFSYCSNKFGSIYEIDCTPLYSVNQKIIADIIPYCQLQRVYPPNACVMGGKITLCAGSICTCRTMANNGTSDLYYWYFGRCQGMFTFDTTFFNVIATSNLNTPTFQYGSMCRYPNNPGLCLNTTYYWAVVPIYYNGAVHVPLTPPRSATTCGINTGNAPSTPTLNSPSNGSTITPTTALEWNASTNVCSYQIQISNNVSYMNTCNDYEGFNCTYTGVTCTSTVFNSVFNVSDGTYWWRVRGINDGWYGCWSGCSCFTLLSGFTHVGLVNGILVQSSAGNNGNMVLCSGTMYYRTDSECSNRSITLTTSTGILKVGCQ